MTDKRDPLKPFYLVVSIDNLDKTIEIGKADMADFDHEHEARARLVEEVSADDPLPHVVFLCVPILMHERRPMKIIDIPNGIVPTTRQKRKARKA